MRTESGLFVGCWRKCHGSNPYDHDCEACIEARTWRSTPHLAPRYAVPLDLQTVLVMTLRGWGDVVAPVDITGRHRTLSNWLAPFPHAMLAYGTRLKNASAVLWAPQLFAARPDAFNALAVLHKVNGPWSVAGIQMANELMSEFLDMKLVIDGEERVRTANAQHTVRLREVAPNAARTMEAKRWGSRVIR